MLGYVPIGFAYGVLGRAAGLPTWAILAMCILVYAGSAQFIAVSLLAAGEPAVTVIVTTFIVNLRHLLYSSAIAPRLERMSRGQAGLGCGRTDRREFRHGLACGGGTAAVPELPLHVRPAGNRAGVLDAWARFWARWPDLSWGIPTRLGLDYALVAMFLGLLALQIHGRREVVVALVAGALSLVLHLVGVGSTGVILGDHCGEPGGASAESAGAAKEQPR